MNVYVLYSKTKAASQEKKVDASKTKVASQEKKVDAQKEEEKIPLITRPYYINSNGIASAISSESVLQEKKVDAQKEEEKIPQFHYINSNGISTTISSEYVFAGMDFKSTELDEINPMEARFVTRKHKNKTKTVFIEPKIYDIHYPVKGYFNLEKSTIVLVFDDGSKVKTISESASKSKAHTGVLISLAKRILGPQSETDRNSIGAIYNKFNSDAQAEAAFYGIVMSYFVSNGLVKDPATFDMWLVEFLTKYLVQMTDKKSNKKE